jgi:GNAT superfamily N-acetyltransferase
MTGRSDVAGETAAARDRASARDKLALMLSAAAAGHFPPADGGVTILGQPSDREAGVIAFTAHAVVFADVDRTWISANLPADDLSAPLSPPFLQLLSKEMGREPHSIDVLTCADPLPGPPPLELSEIELAIPGQPSHPRIDRALNYRDDVRAWQAHGGVLMLGRGVAGRWELAIEVDADNRSAGLGRQLASAARHLVSADAVLWAQIAPGNSASLRAFLHAGFRPIGAEALLSRQLPA